jgi:hypothetical protein
MNRKSLPLVEHSCIVRQIRRTSGSYAVSENRLANTPLEILLRASVCSWLIPRLICFSWLINERCSVRKIGISPEENQSFFDAPANGHSRDTTRNREEILSSAG